MPNQTPEYCDKLECQEILEARYRKKRVSFNPDDAGPGLMGFLDAAIAYMQWDAVEIANVLWHLHYVCLASASPDSRGHATFLAFAREGADGTQPSVRQVEPID